MRSEFEDAMQRDSNKGHESGAYLVSGESTEGRDVLLRVEELPELLSTSLGQGVINSDGWA